MSDFLESAPSAEVVFARTYSRRKDDGSRENFEEAMLRTVDDISRIGKFTPEEYALVREQALAQHSFPSGRAFWVAGTEWSKQPKNFYGYYNCSNVHVEDIEAFGIMMDLAMQGTGTGAILEQEVVSKLPKVTRKLILKNVTDVGTRAGDPDTKTYLSDETMIVMVGDSREGWRKAYMNLLYQATTPLKSKPLDVYINLEQVRPSGTKLKGFGGTANPVKLPEMFGKVINILNGAVGRQLTPVECCLIIDEAATCVVAGNIRRSAGMRQFSKEDQEAANAKLGLYRQDENGKWSVDPVKEALRMANHTRCYHTKPSYEEVEAAVRLQFQSGEGAIQYVPEAIARANVDILSDKTSKQMFLDAYTNEGRDAARQLLNSIHQAFTDNPLTVKELDHRMDRYGLNPCLTGDTPILTVHQGAKTFEELVAAGEDVLVWCVNKETNEAAVRMMRNPRITGYNQPILEVEFDSGLKVRATHNHNFFTLQRNKVQAKDLKVGQSVSAFAIHQHRNGHLRITRNNKLTDSVRQQFCHRVIAEYHGIEGEVIHHVDGDPTNNMPGNLEATTASEHNREHYADRCRNGFYHGTPGPAAAEHIANHKVVAIRDAGTATVYNGTVDEHHNYVVVDPSSVGKSYVSGILSANCGEIISRDFMCNLAEVHLNTIDPSDVKGQEDAFYAAGLQVAALLQHEFTHERLQYSRSIDPIVGVSFTGLWDHLVHSYGSEWLEWMMDGCPEGDQRKKFRDGMITKFVTWRAAAHRGVEDYCKKHGLRIPNRITTVQPAGCLEADAIRVFDQGLLCADEIVDPGSGETIGLDLSVRDGIGATTAIANDPLKLVKLTFENGRTLRMTPDHRLSVNGDWKRADAMELGDIVDCSFGEYNHSKEHKLKQLDPELYSSSEYRKHLTGESRGVMPRLMARQPVEVTPALSWFVGALYGNGCMSKSKNRIRFCHGNKAILREFAKIGQDLFGIEATFSQIEGKVEEVCFASKMMFDWFNINNLSKTEKSRDLSRIPLPIRQSSNESILAFFAGLIDTDGCARNNSFSIDMASEDFLRHLQQIGEAVGLCFGLSHNTKGDSFQNKKSIWSLHLSRMKSKLSCVQRLNELSLKLVERPVKEPSRQFSYEPYAIKSIEFEETADYTFDFAVEGVNDDDSWYWQGGLKSHNTKSLLTGASSGWHPPKAQRFIRRITLGVRDPLVPALIEHGYSVIPAQSARDEEGNLLDDIADPRVHEVLVEIPTEVSWANLPGCDKFDLAKLPIEAQWELYMLVQQCYCDHNTSATLEIRENEIETLAKLIYTNIQTDGGYISAALLARFDVDSGTFPRLPFEPIDKDTYEALRLPIQIVQADDTRNLLEILRKYDSSDWSIETVSGCANAACVAKADADERERML